MVASHPLNKCLPSNACNAHAPSPRVAIGREVSDVTSLAWNPGGDTAKEVSYPTMCKEENP